MNTQMEFDKTTPEGEAEFAEITSNDEVIRFLSTVGVSFDAFRKRDHRFTNPYMVTQLKNSDQWGRCEVFCKERSDFARCTLPDSSGNSNYRFELSGVWVTYFPYVGELQLSRHKGQHREVPRL
jgi:hypothetical protein